MADDFDFDFGDFDFSDFDFDPSAWNWDWDFGDFPVGDPFAGLDFSDFDWGNFGDFDQFGEFDFDAFGNDPFALPTADFELPDFDIDNVGALTLPDLDPQLLDLLGGENLTDPYTLTRFDAGIPGGTTLADFDQADLDMLGRPGLGLGDDFPGIPSATNIGSPGLDAALSLSPQRQLDEALRPTSLSEQLQRAQIQAMERQGTGRGTDWTGLGQLGLGLAGLGLKYFGPEPERRVDPLDEEERRARIAKINAETERIMNPIFPPRGGGGGGGGARMPPPPGGAFNVAEFQRAAGLPEMQARFNALYDQVLKETQDLPKPTPEALSQMSQQLMQAQVPQIRQDFELQRQNILERANRLGVNPAAELAQVNQAEQQALQQLTVQAQTQALAFIQAQQAALVGRLTPAVQILQQINPAQAWGDLARVFGFPRPAGAPSLAGALEE